jgi:hypothetical protein
MVFLFTRRERATKKKKRERGREGMKRIRLTATTTSISYLPLHSHAPPFLLSPEDNNRRSNKDDNSKRGRERKTENVLRKKSMFVVC